METTKKGLCPCIPSNNLWSKPSIKLKNKKASLTNDKNSEGNIKELDKIHIFIENIDKTFSALIKIGISTIGFVATFIIAIHIYISLEESIIIEKFTNETSDSSGPKDLTPALINKIANTASHTIISAPIMSEMANTSKISFKLGTTDLALDEVIKILRRALDSTIQFEGSTYKINDRFGSNLRMNGVTLPGGEATSKDLKEIIEKTSDRLIAATQPLLFATTAINKASKSSSKLQQLQNAQKMLQLMKPFYTKESLRSQALVAESNILQEIGDLPGSLSLLKKVAHKNSDPLLNTELALRAHFAGNVELAMKYAKASKSNWDDHEDFGISNDEYNAMKAQNHDIAARYTGDYRSAKSAIDEYSENEASAYNRLDLNWDASLHLLHAGDFEEAENMAAHLNFWAPSEFDKNSNSFVEGPAEYNMNLAIMKEDWPQALKNALYADKIHLCQEPTKLYQRAAIHKPWIDYLKDVNIDKKTKIDIRNTQFNSEEECYLCLRLKAHRILLEAARSKDDKKVMLIKNAIDIFNKATNLAPSSPFAYFERGLASSLIDSSNGDHRAWMSDIGKARSLGPKWLPPMNLIKYRKRIENPMEVFLWSMAASGLTTENNKKVELSTIKYIDTKTIEESIKKCQRENS